MDQKCTNDTRFSYNKELDENLAWLTQKTEDLPPPPPPPPAPISTSTPPFQVYPPFLAKHFLPTPQVSQFLEGPTPTP